MRRKGGRRDVTTSFWESRRAGSDRPPAPSLPSHVDVLVVGAGFLGLWLARFLLRSRPSLVLLVVDRDRFPCGASSRNAGFLTAGQLGELLADRREFGEEAVLETFRRRREGVALFRRELPVAVDACGSADFDGVTEEKLAFAERVGGFEVRELPFGGGFRRALFRPDDGGIDPVEALDALRAGLPIAYGVDVAAVGAGRAIAAGREIAYGHAFVCTNAFARALDPHCGVEPGRGQVIVTSRVAAPPPATLGFLDEGYDYFRYVDGRLLVGGGRHRFRDEERTEAARPTPAIGAYLRARAEEVLGHGRFTVDWHWAGIMGFPAGRHLPAYPARDLDPSTTVVAGCGGMGVALAPLRAHSLAREFTA